jgi:hypothetical protein
VTHGIQAGDGEAMEGLIFTESRLHLCGCATVAKPQRGKGCWPPGVLAKGWSRVIPFLGTSGSFSLFGAQVKPDGSDLQVSYLLLEI